MFPIDLKDAIWMVALALTVIPKNRATFILMLVYCLRAINIWRLIATFFYIKSTIVVPKFNELDSKPLVRCN